jgi:hypothetical protein
MNPITLLFRLPLLAVQGVIRVAELVQDQAEHELYDPLAVRRHLEDAAAARDAGVLSDEEVRQVEEETVGRLVHRGDRDPAGDDLSAEER